MKRSIHLFLTFLLFFIGNNVEANSDEKQISNKNDLSTNPIHDKTENSSKIFIVKDINYYAPQSGTVYLVWNTDSYPLNESVTWNENTKLTKGLLYLPMIAHSDTFNVKLKVPVGTTIQYYFWITKTKQGHYQDFWDLQSSGKTTIIDANPIDRIAIYSKVEKKLGSRLLTIGWMILLSLSCIYLVLIWIDKKWFDNKKKPSIIENVLFMGISLALFFALARAEIIAVNPLKAIYNFRILAIIIRGSFHDLLYICCLVIVFIIFLWLIKNGKIRKVGYGIFLFLALISTLIAFTNITTVIFLGKPFTYQWLYYSDFLGSTEAKTALRENLSLAIVGNLLALIISMVILSGILSKTNRILLSNRHLKNITYSIFGFCLIVLFLSASRTKVTWTKGQSENAILSMFTSIFSANSNSSFFSAKIPADMDPFDPAQSTILEKPYNTHKDQKVKNVLFIILESAGASYFDGFGGTYQLSPNLNKYASHSLIFDQMYAHAPATNLSLASILGSMYPYLSYKSLTQEAPDVEHPTLSSVLKENGYKTSFFSSADLRFQNCRQFLAHRGFDVVEDFSEIQCVDQFQEDNFKELNGIDDLCLSNRLTSWLDGNLNQNFFSVLWTVQGHYPYFFNHEEEDFRVNDFNFNRYLNCLKHNDELVGEVMHGLEERGLDSTTLVFVIGDHGEAFGQHQQYGHGTAIYDENLRVPFYLINPRLFHGEHKNDIAGMKDLATTTLSLLNIEIPKKWQGRDLLSTVSNETFFFAPWSDYLFGYRKDNMKYIFNESQNTVEVYDLKKDPKEKINLNNDIGKEEIEYARHRLAAWAQFQDKFIRQMLTNNVN
jgi:phosphoglycerol transferase MdoB-like AlkP superfamily enzyme